MRFKQSFYGTLPLLFVLGALISRNAEALNYYELEVYPYRIAAPGELEVENFTAYTARGTDAPSRLNQNVTRDSIELTYGLTEHLEVAGYLDTFRDGAGVSLGGERFHVRAAFFHKGQLPVDLGAYIEWEMPKHDVDTQEAELRGIIEKDFGRWTVDINPMFEKVLRGANAGTGWELKYANALVYRLNEKLQPRLEFFGDFGPLKDFEPRDEQSHLISPALTYSPKPTLHLTGGVAFGLTRASEQRLWRLRVEWEFY